MVMNLHIVQVKTQVQMDELIEQLATSFHQKRQEEWRRNKWRMTFETMGTVYVESEDDPIYITLHDLSNEGIGFLSPHELKEYQKILVTIETDKYTFKVSATVKHCTKTVGMFKIGAKFNLL